MDEQTERQIEEINRKIFELKMEKASILQQCREHEQGGKDV